MVPQLYGAAIVLFLIFFVYMGLFENVSVYKSDNPHSYTNFTDYTLERVEDETAPVGIRKVYRWTLDIEHSSESCLCFYVSHHYVDVLYDGELMYSLRSSENNRIGDSVSSSRKME